MSGGIPFWPNLCNGTDIGSNTGTSRGTQVSCGSANTMSGYSVLTASCPIDACWMILMPGTGSGGSHNCAWNVAIGATGSEQIIAQYILATGPTNPGVQCYLLPCNIKAGTQISVQVQGDVSDTGGAAPAFSMIVFEGSFETPECGVDTIGFVSGSTRGTTVSCASANTKGSYAILTASTARDYVGFIPVFDGLNTGGTSNCLVDIAIGATGSEKVILPNFSLSSQGSQTPRCFALNGILPIAIPAGTQIQARLQSGLGATSFGLTLYGIYL